MTSSLMLEPRKASTISCSLMGMEKRKISTIFSMSLFLTNLPSLVTGFHSTSSFFLSGRLPPFLSAPLPNPRPASGLGGGGACSAINSIKLNVVMKQQKNNIQVEMAVKSLAFNIFSAIFAVAIVLTNWMSCCLLRLMTPVQDKSALAKNIISRWVRVSDSGKRQIIEYVQIMINLLVGLAFSEWLVSYHCFFVETIVTITYQLHLLSLNWAVDLPDYSAFLKESEAVKIVTVLFYLLFGFVGLSTQMAFTLDLISVFSYPFRALHRFFQRTYSQLIKLKDIMINILTIKKKYWVTCPYPEYLLNDTFKIVYICALPLVFYLIILIKLYSLFMGTLILIFKTISNIGANLSLLLEETGRIVCTLAGLDIEDESLSYNNKTLKEKMESVNCKLSLVDWVPVFKWKKMKQTFLGTQSEPLCFEQPMTINFVSIISVYQTFSQHLH